MIALFCCDTATDSFPEAAEVVDKFQLIEGVIPVAGLRTCAACRRSS